MEKSVTAKISEAIREGDVAALKVFFSQNPEQVNCYTYAAGQTWLGYAAQIGNIAVFRELVSCGFDINIGSKHDNHRPISSAAFDGHEEVVEFLVAMGAELPTETSAENPLFAAIVGRSPECVRLILEAGIDATARYNTRTMKNMDAVAFAMMQGEVECAHIIALWNAGGDEAAAQAAMRDGDHIASLNVVKPRKR